MTDTYLSNLFNMRITVGYLGERSQFSWWPTAFYSQSSRQFLEPVFSKTIELAQYHGVLEAARLAHDEHLNVGSYHLFRLPEEVEQDIHALFQGRAGENLARLVPVSKEDALNALKRMAEKRSFSGVGPTAVGNIADLNSIDTIEAIATAYFSAFTQDVKTYPYLVG